MKIALLAPSPTPYIVGGAQKLWSGLKEHIELYTTHSADIIELPTKEKTFWDIIDSYYLFYNLDLSSYDLVISGKYPAWMSRHPNHHIYMLHTLRGLYEHYPKTPKTPKNTKIEHILSYISTDGADTKTLFSMLAKLRENSNPKDKIYNFPADFIRILVRFFDKQAFKHIKSFSAISKTVAQREGYFPKNSHIKILYPPSTLKRFENNSYSYLLSVSRLDKAKRVDLIIQAYKDSRIDIPLKIVGTGDEMEDLKKLSKGLDVEFFGFVSDEKLSELYANSYAVIFIPFEEDYGIVTIEAMMSQKALITTTDSGGVLEFAKEKKTALVTTPNLLSKAIKTLFSDKTLAVKLGKRAKKTVKDIEWKFLVNSLIKSPKNLTILTTYPIYPPMGGGQNRVYYIYKALARDYNITIVALVHSSLKKSKKAIAHNLYEIQIPKTKEHEAQESALSKELKVTATDLAMMMYYNLTPDYTQAILSSSPHLLIVTSPYTTPLIKEHIKVPFIYESQNVEHYLKSSIINSQKILDKLYEVEKQTITDSILTTVCAQEDEENFKKIYNISASMPLLPNGVDTKGVEFISKKRRAKLKNSKTLTALFIGSAHKPNQQALQEILKVAKTLPSLRFVILGGICDEFSLKPTPPNVELKGFVSDFEKQHYLATADFALNPIKSGSGSNIKMLDYLASGLPVITTSFGARGLNLPPSSVICTDDIEEFKDYFSNISYYIDTAKVSRYVRHHYDWRAIAQKFKLLLESLR